jgi:hypothetical protein
MIILSLQDGSSIAVRAVDILVISPASPGTTGAHVAVRTADGTTAILATKESMTYLVREVNDLAKQGVRL